MSVNGLVIYVIYLQRSGALVYTVDPLIYSFSD